MLGFSFGRCSILGTAAILGATSLLAGLSGSACGPITQPAHVIPPTPTAAPSVTHPAAIPSDRLIIVNLQDVTSSAIRFSAEAKALIADHLDELLLPGRGGVQLVAGTISSNSFDPLNTKLSVRFAGLPPKPAKAVVRARPSPPDLTSCQKNPFDRPTCETKLVDAYKATLAGVLDDETKADHDFQAASADWQQLYAARVAEVEAIAGQLRDLPLKLDSTGTDIWGALLRAAETFSSSKAPQKLLLVSGDWLISGRQQEGELRFPPGTIVKTVFYDCDESRDCLARKKTWTEKLLAAGAERVIWVDPGASRIQADLFDEVTH